MKKFEFELEDVLQFRKFEQQQAEIELGKALAQEKQIQDKIDSIAMQINAENSRVKGSKDFNSITQALRFNEFAKKQTEYLLNEMAQAKVVSEQKREVLKLCIQKTDSLEKLKETKFDEYKAELIKEDDEEIEDIITSTS